MVWYLNLTFSHQIWNHTHICNNNLHLLYWCWISLDEIALWRWHLLYIYLDLKGSHWSLKLCSHCHQTIADFYHWWGLVNRQAYKAGESLNQIQLCHLVQSMKLQVENNIELLQFLHILSSCDGFSYYYGFSNIAIHSVNPLYDDWNFQRMAS